MITIELDDFQRRCLASALYTQLAKSAESCSDEAITAADLDILFEAIKATTDLLEKISN